MKFLLWKYFGFTETVHISAMECSYYGNKVLPLYWPYSFPSHTACTPRATLCGSCPERNKSKSSHRWVPHACSKQLQASEIRKEQTGYSLIVHQCVQSVSLRFLWLKCFINPVNTGISVFLENEKFPKLLIMVQFSRHVSMVSSRNNNQDFILDNFLIFARKAKNLALILWSLLLLFFSALYECKPFWEIYEIILSKMLYYKTT